MSWLATGLGGRAVALGASLAAHSAVAIAVFGGGHATPAGRDASGPAVEIAIDVAPLAPQPADAPALNARAPGDAPHPAMHTHTHPYPVPPDHDLHPHDPSIEHHPFGGPIPESPEAPAAAPATLAASAPVAHFTMAIAPGTIAFGAVSAHGDHAGEGGVAEDAHDDAPVPASGVTVPARRVDAPLAPYPDDARRAGVEGDVPIEIVVDARGLVESARPLRHVGYGLDEAALASIRRWRFTPAQKDGRVVRVRMTCDVSFRLE